MPGLVAAMAKKAMPTRLIGRTDDHERLAHPQVVRDQTGDDEGERVGDPVPVGERVGLGLRIAVDGREVDDREAGGDVVQQQEQADRERGPEDARPDHLAPEALGEVLELQAGSARLDQDAVAHGHHQLVADPR